MKQHILLLGCILTLVVLHASAVTDNVGWIEELEGEIQQWRSEPPEHNAMPIQEVWEGQQDGHEQDNNNEPPHKFVDTDFNVDEPNNDKAEFNEAEILQIQEIKEEMKANIAMGYNLLRGNPVFSVEGVDPGIMKGRRVLDIDFENPVVFHPTDSCSWVDEVQVFSGTKSYQETLDADITAEGTYLEAYRFSVSAGYSQAKAIVESQRKVMMYKETVCTVGTVQYDWETALNKDHSVTERFFYAVKNLPINYRQKDYEQFLDNYGTHFIIEAKLGGKRVDRFSSSYTDLYKYASQSVSTSVSGSTDSGEVSVDLKNFNEHIQFSTEFGEKQPGFHVGLEIGDDHKVVKGNTPEPTSLKLKPILDVFDPRFWVRLPENENTTPQIERKKWLLKWALLVYPLKLEATIGQDKPITIPITDLDFWTAGNTRCSLTSPCDFRGGPYKWCFTHDGWEYCCAGKCDYNDGKSYQWCNSGNQWEYCGEYPDGKGLRTIDKKLCRDGHPCGKHSYYSTRYWCYTDNDNNWDYCCAPDHQCGKNGWYYNWCYRGDNHSYWDYCKK